MTSQKLTPRKTHRPTLRYERDLIREGATHVAGIDEVGRGALAGPVTVGIVVVTYQTRSAPVGLADSKLLASSTRDVLSPAIRRWAPHHAVASAGAQEIDQFGIIAALRLAGRRALAALDVVPDCVIVDGSHDWLSDPEETLFDVRAAPDLPCAQPPKIVTRVKADQSCASVAAASVLAKTSRDAFMVELASHCPEFRWESNKGYSAADHMAAICAHGPSNYHRKSWNLPRKT